MTLRPWIAFVCALALGGCASIKPSPKGCILPPPQASKAEQENFLKIAAKVEQLKVDGSLEVKFKTTVNEEWTKLNDDNAALYLFLKAIECFSKKSDPVSQEAARAMVGIVRDKYGSRLGRSSVGTKLSDYEREQIRRSKYAPEIMPLAERFRL